MRVIDKPPGPPIHFLHISKTGGTALKHALAPFAQGHGLQLHPHAVTLRQVPTGEKVVFFVRRPLERFVSGFLSRQRQGQPGRRVPWSAGERRAFERFASANALAEALGSGDADMRLRAEAAMDAIGHLRRPLALWLESDAYLRSRLDDVLLLGLQERLAEDFSRLRVLLNLPDAAVLPDGDALAHRAPQDADRHLSKPGAANVMAWYADDCRLFELCRDIALARNA